MSSAKIQYRANESVVHYHVMLVIPLDEAQAAKPEWMFPVKFVASDIRFEGSMPYERAMTHIQAKGHPYTILACYKQDCSNGIPVEQTPAGR